LRCAWLAILLKAESPGSHRGFVLILLRGADKLASYGAAKREIMPGIEHRQHKGSNNKAENSHQPTRRRERQMKRFNPDSPDGFAVS
jgi:transposase-like protein